ncbi:hypothetical protein [Roseburia sp. MSJ-14]|uniref:hypothetical protein n=1 Tax=Roseburia sp. MSJ-14 TaxID=2841514 RepID=UPI001C1210E0|nr:hypothetical protein [Roseburia sp. MSJ-14]MBU5472024.1 hypothetical protein [Roseburia sp. MSJ-14]
MKKRLFALATAVVMTLSMGMPAMAAKSPELNDTPGEEVRGKFAESATAVIDGKVVQLDFTFKTRNMEVEATEAQLEQIRYYMPVDMNLKHEREKDLFEKVMGYRNEDVIYNDYFGLSLPDGYTMPVEGIDVTINAPYAGKGDYTYYIFHCKADGTWEYIPTTEGDGTLSGRFTSFSPVFIMRVPKTNAPETPSESTETTKPVAIGSTGTASAQNVTSTTSKTTAPKTGDVIGIYVAGMLAILSMAGIVVYVKREKVIK